MLVLARKKGQSIVIGNNIKVYLLEVTGETARLGIEAPPGIEVFRSELFEALMEENSGALTSSEEAVRLLKKNLPANNDKKLGELEKER